MWEVLAVGVGIAIGAGTATLFGSRRRWSLLAMAFVAGIAISTASGEIAESPVFALFDTAQVLVAAALTAVLIAQLGPRRARR